MNKTLFIIAGLILFATSFAPPAFCESREGRYFTLQYSSREILRKFDDQIDLSGSLGRMMRKNTVTVEDEVVAKTEAIVDHYFKVRPPYTIHELMAQFTEKHITD